MRFTTTAVSLPHLSPSAETYFLEWAILDMTILHTSGRCGFARDCWLSAPSSNCHTYDHFNLEVTTAIHGTNSVAGLFCRLPLNVLHPLTVSLTCHPPYERDLLWSICVLSLPYRNLVGLAFYLSFVFTVTALFLLPLICAQVNCKAAPCRRTIAAFPLTTDIYC